MVGHTHTHTLRSTCHSLSSFHPVLLTPFCPLSAGTEGLTLADSTDWNALQLLCHTNTHTHTPMQITEYSANACMQGISSPHCDQLFGW